MNIGTIENEKIHSIGIARRKQRLDALEMLATLFDDEPGLNETDHTYIFSVYLSRNIIFVSKALLIV